MITSSPTPRVTVDSPTEARNPDTVDIDLVSTAEAIAMVHAEDARVIAAVQAVTDRLAALVDDAAQRVTAGGQVHYFGAGTSGRLGVIDAAELPPTFGTSDIVIAHHAGGVAALLRAAENVEDSTVSGAHAASALTSADVAIGLTASGRTPYVAGALETAQAVGAATALITSHPQPELAPLADYVLAADTGPEVITGSTRMKAGTAEKLILNAFSTVLMVKLGKVYSNLMITMQPTNAKLRGRAINILVQATGESFESCAAALEAAGDIPTALTWMLSTSNAGNPSGHPSGNPSGTESSTESTRTSADLTAARTALTQAGGRVRQAVAAIQARNEST